MGHNGLSSASLFNNALTTNPTALAILMKSPLRTETFKNDEYLKRQLLDQSARDVLSDIVSCALGPDASVEDWHGELGLCTKAPEGDWSKQPPTSRCLQLVSACLFARVNALQRRVPVSFHAEGALLPLRSRVRMETKYRESLATDGLSAGTLIDGFADNGSCPSGHDCSWKPAHVGTCQPGTDMNVALSGLSSSQCSTTAVQICWGIYGCKKSDQGVVPPSALEYSGFVDQRGGCAGTFKCPSYGAYGVMVQPATAGSTFTVEVAAAPSATYPAAETDVFPFREAAFFGNLFEPSQLTRHREIIISGGKPVLKVERRSGAAGAAQSLCRAGAINNIPYQHVYACYSLQDTRAGSKDIQLSDQSGVANLNDRVCATATSSCFPNPPESCTTHCQWNQSTAAYEGCSSSGPVYPAITTFLDAPCSLVGARQCAVLRAERNQRQDNNVPR
jgi:hypothetical protein